LRRACDEFDVRALALLGRRVEHIARAIIKGHGSRRELRFLEVGPPLGFAPPQNVRVHGEQLLERRIALGTLADQR
jgi:hypothetical protein